MKILFDTCVVVDYLQKQVPFVDASREALLLASEKRCDGYLSAKSVADIYYLVHRSLHDSQKTKDVLRILFGSVGLLDTSGYDVQMALDLPMKDYEDAILACDAFNNHVDYIVTRNKKDFESSPVPAITPEEFLSLKL